MLAVVGVHVFIMSIAVTAQLLRSAFGQLAVHRGLCLRSVSYRYPSSIRCLLYTWLPLSILSCPLAFCICT